MTEFGKMVQAADELQKPVTIGSETYVSQDYARAEQDRHWRRVRLQASRLEDIPPLVTSSPTISRQTQV
jgi:hypothetical protein